MCRRRKRGSTQQGTRNEAAVAFWEALVHVWCGSTPYMNQCLPEGYSKSKLGRRALCSPLHPYTCLSVLCQAPKPTHLPVCAVPYGTPLLGVANRLFPYHPSRCPSPMHPPCPHHAAPPVLPPTLAAMAAPCAGGFEYMGRATCFIWLSTRLASAGFLHASMRGGGARPGGAGEWMGGPKLAGGSPCMRVGQGGWGRRRGLRSKTAPDSAQ